MRFSCASKLWSQIQVGQFFRYSFQPVAVEWFGRQPYPSQSLYVKIAPSRAINITNGRPFDVDTQTTQTFQVEQKDRKGEYIEV